MQSTVSVEWEVDAVERLVIRSCGSIDRARTQPEKRVDSWVEQLHRASAGVALIGCVVGRSW